MTTQTFSEQEIREFTNREVIYCVSMLMQELLQKGVADEDYWHLYEKTEIDYTEAQQIIENAGFMLEEHEDGIFVIAEFESGVIYHQDSDYEAVIAEFFDERNLDLPDCTHEVYEHWIVNDWLADRLAEKGEAVEKDFIGMTIWGRTTTGQAIYSDRVIQEIYADLKNNK